MTHWQSIINFESDHKSKLGNIWIPFAIFIFAFLVRLTYLHEIKHSPLFYYPQVDAETYVEMARQIANGSFFRTNNLSFYQPPMYPFFLAIIFKTLGHNLYYVHLLQFIIGSINCVLIYFLASACFSKKAGLVAGFIASLYWPFIFFEGEVLAPFLIIFFDLCFLLSFVKYIKSHKIIFAIVSGAFLGLSAITRPNILVFGWIAFPVVIIYLIINSRSKMRNKEAAFQLTGLFMFLFASFIIIAPVTIYNWSKDKSFVLISHNGGINFYIGNSPQKEKAVDIRPGEEWEIFTSTPKLENPNKHYSGADFSRYWYDKSYTFIRHYPMEFFRNSMKKPFQLIHAYELKRNLDVYFFKKYNSHLLTMPLFSFGIIAPLAILGMILAKKESKNVVLLLFVCFYSASIVLFFVTSRYRLPIVPVLIIFASYAIINLIVQLKNKLVPWKSIVILTISICLVNVDVFHLKPTPKQLVASEAESWYYIGRAIGEQSSHVKNFNTQLRLYQKAIDTMEKSIAIDSSFACPYNFIGIYSNELVKLLLNPTRFDSDQKGQKKSSVDEALQYLTRAEQHFRSAHRLEPRLTSPMYNLCLALYYRNIIDFNFFSENQNAVKRKIIERSDEIDKITDELLKSKRVSMYEKFQNIKRRAHLQKQEALRILG